ncbi:hypothetical protein AtNW77_Chr5g0120661 [Arabidopsis thaliana]
MEPGFFQVSVAVGSVLAIFMSAALYVMFYLNRTQTHITRHIYLCHNLFFAVDRKFYKQLFLLKS